MEIFKLFGTILVKDKEALRSLNNVDNTAQSTSQKMSSAFKKIGAAVVTYFAIDKITQFGKACTEASAEVEAEASAFNSTLGKNSDVMTRKLQELGDKTGITYTRMTEASTLYYNKWVQAGYDSEKAMKMTTDSIELGADAAAYYNMSLDDANGNIKSFINGNFEAGDAIGVSTNATGIAAWATKKLGIDYNKAGESQKQAIRQEYLQYMYDVSGVTGQASKESGAYENQVGNLKEAWRQFKAVIGEPLLNNIVLPAIKGLTDFVNNSAIPAFNDIKTKVGDLNTKWQEFKGKLEECKTWIDNNKTAVELLAVGFATLGFALLAYNGPAIIAAAASVAETLAIYGLITAEAIATGATTLLAGATSVLGAVIGFLTSPITLVIVAIGLLVAAGILLYKNWDTVKSYAISIWNGITSTISNAINGAKESITNTWNAITSWLSGIWSSIRSLASGAWNGIKSTIVNVVNGIKSNVINIWNSIKSTTLSVWNGIKSSVSNVVNGIRSTVSNVFNAVKSTVTTVWNGIKSAIINPITAAKNTVKRIVDQIKGFFLNMKLSLPKIKIPSLPKLPKVKISGGFSLNPPSVPKISWNAEGGVFNKPTIFGTNAGLQGVGEAGPEAILPLNNFYKHLDKKLNENKNNIDYDRMAKCMVKAVSNIAILMDNKTVGKTTYRTVQDETNKNKKRMDRLAGVVDV